MSEQRVNGKVVATKGNPFLGNNQEDYYFLDMSWVNEHMFDKTMKFEDIPRLALYADEYDNRDAAMHNCVCFSHLRVEVDKNGLITGYEQPIFCYYCARMMVSTDCVEHTAREKYNLTHKRKKLLCDKCSEKQKI